MPILNERGYLIPAVNNTSVDYIECAKLLATSIKSFHPTAKICLLTDKHIDDSIFDYVKILPHGDQSPNQEWKLNNDWQCFTASPFRQTIKLEADMIATSPIDHWWTVFEHRDLAISQGCRDFYGQLSKSRYYRKVFDSNNLPDVYNAITYWRVSQTAKEFFDLVRAIFSDWDSFKKLLKFPDDVPTTDLVYAMAANIVGVENCILPTNFGPTIVHMKRHIIPTHTSDWSNELIWENADPGLRIHTITQSGFFHYHIKDWAKTNE